MGQSCGVTHSSKGTTAHQHSTNTSSHPHTPHLPRGQMRHQKKMILGREGEVTTPFTTWNMLERVCTNKDNVIWYKGLFQSSWLLSLDNSNLFREKTRVSRDSKMEMSLQFFMVTSVQHQAPRNRSCSSRAVSVTPGGLKVLWSVPAIC